MARLEGDGGDLQAVSAQREGDLLQVGQLPDPVRVAGHANGGADANHAAAAVYPQHGVARAADGSVLVCGNHRPHQAEDGAEDYDEER